MTSERVKTVKGLLDEHRRRRAKVGNPRRAPLAAQIPGGDPISKWFKDRNLNPADFRSKT